MVETLCDVNGILEAAQCSCNLSVLSRIGKKAAELHLAKYGRRPDKQPAKVHGKTYNVYCYGDEDRWMVYRSAAIVLTAEYGKDNHHVLQSWLHRLLSSCQQWPKAAATIARLSEAVDRKVRTFTESLRTDRDGTARLSLIETCTAIAVPAFTNAAIALFDSIISSHHISADDAVLATWLTTGRHPKTILFETLKRQTELWIALRGRGVGDLFSQSQRKLLIKALVQWKNGRQFKPLDRKLRNAERFEEFRRRLRPSLN